MARAKAKHVVAISGMPTSAESSSYIQLSSDPNLTSFSGAAKDRRGVLLGSGLRKRPCATRAAQHYLTNRGIVKFGKLSILGGRPLDLRTGPMSWDVSAK